jgi:hypothetical protein
LKSCGATAPEGIVLADAAEMKNAGRRMLDVGLNDRSIRFPGPFHSSHSSFVIFIAYFLVTSSLKGFAAQLIGVLSSEGWPAERSTGSTVTSAGTSVRLSTPEARPGTLTIVHWNKFTGGMQ